MKKFLLSALALVAVAALAITGTIAYLQWEESDVNVMTLGNVKIEQLEYERVLKADGTYEMVTSDKYGEGYKLQDFNNDKPLYPATGEITGWGKKVPFDQLGEGASGAQQVLAGLNNVQDKFVLVKNTGKSDAYVRTFIALEYGSNTKDIVGITTGDFWEWHDDLGIQNIDGNNYYVFEAVYKGSDTRHIGGVLPAGEYTYNSLGQIYLKNEATNEDMEKLDVNGDGKYNILVLSQACQVAGFENAADAFANARTKETVSDAAVALDIAFGAPEAPSTIDNESLCADWFEGVIAEHSVSVWDGTVDADWYDDTKTEFVITTAEQLAGFSKLVDEGKTFEGKTVKLGKDIDLHVVDDAGEPISFNPIGSYRHDKVFMGIFDGQNYTISNMSQNTWALDTGYYYSDCGLGLFGAVEGGTVKNLVMDGASISGESGLCGTVAAVAENATFENITVKNSNVADYQYYAGGIVGWASGNHKYINCNVDATTTIAAQWGDFDNSTGGMIGGAGGSAEILMKDCTVACRIDAYNDVTSSYQWYAYRRCGMLIGNSGKTETVDGRTVAVCPQLTCEKVTVVYGDWANYTYCEFAGTSWPYVRVQAGVSNSAYSNPRYGHPTDANGNEVVDDNHVHNAGEDHFIECTFDQLYGGGQGVYGTATHDGVTVVYNNK